VTTERRQHARRPVELQVAYEQLNAFFADYTRNISKGGTFIRSTRSLPLGTVFRFRLVVPGRSVPFELEGVVVRNEMEEIGRASCRERVSRSV
jgi:type IV pilus assembly protein PilZ